MDTIPDDVNVSWVAKYFTGWRRTFDYKGTATRSEFWTFILVNMAVSFVVACFSEGAAVFWDVVTLLPEIALTIRRLRDFAWSPYWAIPLWICMLALYAEVPEEEAWMMSLVGIAGLGSFICLGVMRGKEEMSFETGRAENMTVPQKVNATAAEVSAEESEAGSATWMNQTELYLLACFAGCIFMSGFAVYLWWFNGHPLDRKLLMMFGVPWFLFAQQTQKLQYR